MAPYEGRIAGAIRMDDYRLIIRTESKSALHRSTRQYKGEPHCRFVIHSKQIALQLEEMQHKPDGLIERLGRLQ